MGYNNIESLTVDVGQHQVHYLKAGTGPPVVLVHGGASDSRDWMDVMSELSGSYSLYAPDLLGYGASSKTGDNYYMSDFVEFTHGFIRALGLEAPVLVGHSLGGRVCLEIALGHPREVGKLVLVDSAGFGAVTRHRSMMVAALWRVRKLLKKEQPYPAILQEEGAHDNWDCLDRLPGLEVPTLLIWKRYDPYFPLSRPLKAKKLMPDAALIVVPGYGHAPHKEDTDYFNRYLRNFLNGGSSGRMKHTA